jgi:NAD(P)-dependent dehydrogenase (short-subunit alcohol dehydrogenase family)
VNDSALRTYAGAQVIITGGASGIGRALGEELARRGAEVVLADLQIDLAEQVAAGIRAAGGKATAANLDVTDFQAVASLVQEVADRAGRLDYLFNNAGIVVAGEAHHYELPDWDRVIDVNLRGVIHGVQAAYPLMRRQGFGHIVNTASVAGLIPVPGLLSYCTSKYAVVGLSTSLRIEAAEQGIRVSVLCPGAVETPIAGGGKFGKILDAPPPEIQRRLWEESWPIPVERLARSALNAIARNRAVIVTPWWWKLAWWVYRYFPAASVALSRKRYRASKELIEKTRRPV